MPDVSEPGESRVLKNHSICRTVIEVDSMEITSSGLAILEKKAQNPPPQLLWESFEPRHVDCPGVTSLQKAQ